MLRWRVLRRAGTLLWTLAGAAVLASCARPGLEHELLRRHASVETGEAPGLVAVTVHARPMAPEPDDARLFRLSKSAQSELIESVAAKTGSLEALLTALAAPAGPPADPSSGGPPTRYRRRIVVSAESRRAGVADRIARLRVVLVLDTAEARFVGWDRFVTRHGTAEVGEVVLRRDGDDRFALDVDAAPVPGSAGGLTVRAGGSSRLDETLTVSDTYLSTGVLLPDSMILLQRGAQGRDLAGNSVLAVTIELVGTAAVVVHGFTGLRDAAGRPSAPDRVRVRSRRLAHARSMPRGVRARLRFEAMSRTVPPGRGGATFAEADDRVRLLRTVGEGREVSLIAASELRASVWEIADGACGPALHLRRASDARGSVLQLASFEEAEALLRWIRASSADRVGGLHLRLGPDAALDAAGRDRLAVRLRPLNWDPDHAHRCA